MTCRVSSCNYQFCWVCLADWTTHGAATGGYYKCNRYEENLKNDKSLQAEERKREDAKSELARYMFYYERFANHDKAEKHARSLIPVINSKVELLQSLKNYPSNELVFLHDATMEVMRCRQVLKWTYAYGFFCISNKQKQKMD